jgi:hypothetical protein
MFSQIDVFETVYDNQAWICSVETLPAKNILDDFNDAITSISGLSKKRSTFISYDNCYDIYCEAQYGCHDYLSYFDAKKLRSCVISKLATIQELKSYKDVSVKSFKNDLKSTNNYSFSLDEKKDGLEIFISGILFKNSSYIDAFDIDDFLFVLNKALNKVQGLEFAGIVVSTWHANVDGLSIGIDDATYHGNKHLTFINATALRDSIISVIATINEIDDSDIDVEIKTSLKDNMLSSSEPKLYEYTPNDSIRINLNNFTWNDCSWISAPESSLTIINKIFSSIQDLSFFGIQITSKINKIGTDMMISVDRAIYKNRTYLTEDDAVNLKINVLSAFVTSEYRESLKFKEITVGTIKSVS